VPDPTQKHDEQVLRFILQEIDSVPELEALLLIWQNRPRLWTPADLAKRLYIVPEQAQFLLAQLNRKGLIAVIPAETQSYGYETKSPEQDQLMAYTEAVYQREVVRISTLIHSKPSSAVRDFARAFRFTKEKP
jgi:hypothetical protein